MIEAKAPGKLYIGGEYAVVEPGQPAVLVAVNQFITVKVEKSENSGSISSSQHKDSPVSWERKDGKIVLDKDAEAFEYVTAAIEITEAYAQEHSVPLSFFHLTVDSELDNEDGHKYGLGSSAAVTVATIRALCMFYEIEARDELIFKLAVLSHLSLGSNGSFGDLAASVYTGWIAYTGVDREWIKEKKSSLSLTQLVESEWPEFSVTSLTPPENMRFVVGWTGTPASTTKLVDEVREKINTHPEQYKEFLDESKQWVDEMIGGFEAGKVLQIQRGVRNNRAALKDLQKLTGVTIETPALTSFADWAEVYSGAAKFSGAGGGDCGIALFHKNSKLEFVYDKWKERDIEVLPVEVYTK